MKRRNEDRIERAVCRHADALGLTHIKLNVWGRRGYPDRLFFIAGGRPLLIEFKEANYKPRRLQQYTINKLLRLKYDVHSVDNVEEGIELLNKKARGRREWL